MCTGAGDILSGEHNSNRALGSAPQVRLYAFFGCNVKDAHWLLLPEKYKSEWW